MDSSTEQSIASALAGGLAGWVDAQSGEPATVAEPVYGTAYGTAGVAQPTAATLTTSNPTIMLAGLALVAVLILKK